MTQSRPQSQAARRVALIAADLRRYHSSATFVASSLFLASRPRLTQRGHGGFRMSSRSNVGGWSRLTVPLRRLLTLAVIGLCGLSLATLFARANFLADLIANLRVQLVLATLGSLLLSTVFRARGLVITCVIILLFHVPWFILPSPSDNRNLTTGPTLTLRIANVLSANRRFDLITEDLIRNEPDVITVLELTTALDRHLRQELNNTYPHAFTYRQDDGNFGIGIYSRTELIDPEFFYLNDTLTSIRAFVEIDGQSSQIIVTHPLPPIGRGAFEHRNRHLQMLADRCVEFRSDHPDSALVIAGDLNLTPWSPVFTDFVERARVRRATGGIGIQPTWHRWQAFPFGLVLDHVLIDDQLVCRKYVVGSDIGSDHRSVMVDLQRKSASSQFD